MKHYNLIGVIADTHGLLRPEALKALEGADLIIHAGDVDKPEILDALQEIAPVVAVRGNADRGDWSHELPETEVVELGTTSIYILHDVNELDLDPAAAGFGAVISGHSHRPVVSEQNGVLFLNPGSAGAKRFDLPVSIALLRVQESTLDARLIELDI